MKGASKYQPDPVLLQLYFITVLVIEAFDLFHIAEQFVNKKYKKVAALLGLSAVGISSQAHSSE